MLIERLFSAGPLQPHESTRFVQAGSAEAPLSPLLYVPDTWSLEAAIAFQESLYIDAPSSLSSVEENTMPSWLWRHRAEGKETCAESTVMQVINRIAGAATYRGWKDGYWTNELSAALFFDEVRAALLTRRIVFTPGMMAKMGLDWAYGQETPLKTREKAYTARAVKPLSKTLILQNETVDHIMRRTQPLAHEKWQTFFQTSMDHRLTTLAFADTIAQWGPLTSAAPMPGITLNLLAFRQPDGTVDTGGLRQATKIGVLLCELFYDNMATGIEDERPLAVRLSNLSPMLASLGLPYDSDLARSTAGALASIVTATAAATSARLAEKSGVCRAYERNRATILRAMENRLRATFDEKNDYDRLSILPQTLRIESGVDLVLIANARYASQEALLLARKHGLRHLHLTTMQMQPECAPLIDGFSNGVMAMTALTCDYAVGTDQYERRIHPSIPMGLSKIGYAAEDARAVIDHIVGYKTLRAAPGINLSILGEMGFPNETLERLEATLPFVNHISHAFTPWILGIDFFRDTLGLSQKLYEKPTFDLLQHLGFSPQAIAAANAFCCGHRSAKGVLEMEARHIGIFETAEEMPHEATLRMAAAVQSFVTDDVNLTLDVPTALNAQARAALVLRAWELGLKSLTLAVERPYRLDRVEQPIADNNLHVMKRKTPRLATKATMTKKEGTPRRTPTLRSGKPKASPTTVSLKRSPSSPEHNQKSLRPKRS